MIRHTDSFFFFFFRMLRSVLLQLQGPFPASSHVFYITPTFFLQSRPRSVLPRVVYRRKLDNVQELLDELRQDNCTSVGYILYRRIGRRFNVKQCSRIIALNFYEIFLGLYRVQYHMFVYNYSLYYIACIIFVFSFS